MSLNTISKVTGRVRGLLQGDGLRAQLLRGGVGSLAIKAGHAGLAFAVAVVLARTLGPEGYGVYSFALAILMLTAIPAQVGVPQLIVRETAKAQADGDYGLMRGLWRWGNIAVALFSLAALLVMGGILLFTDVGGDGARVTTLTVGLALIPLIALANVRGACLRGLRKVVQGQLPESIVRPALLLALVVIWATFIVPEEGMKAQQAMGLYVTAAVAAFGTGVWLLRRMRPADLTDRPVPSYESSAWRRAVIPLALVTGLQLINNFVDLVILGFFHTNEEVGIYRAVSQIAVLSYFGFQAMNQVLQPHFSRLHRTDQDGTETLWLIRFSSRLLFLLSGPLVIIYALFGKEIIAIFFGEAYLVGHAALVALSFGLVFKSIYGVVATAMNMAGHERKVAYVVLVSVILNILLNLVFVPIFGMNGAAISTATSFVVLGIALRLIAMRVLYQGN